MSESQRDAGLVRAIGPWGLAASIVNIVVGAGIFAVPGALAACIGPYAPLAFLVCGVAIGSVAICFAEGGSRIPTSGGAYGYVEAAFGPLVGYIAGTLLWLGNVLGVRQCRCGPGRRGREPVAATVQGAGARGGYHRRHWWCRARQHRRRRARRAAGRLRRPW